MKRINAGKLMLALLAGGALSAQATLLSYESFSGYTGGEKLGSLTANPATAGYTGDWTGVDFGDQGILVQSGSLDYAGTTELGNSVGVPNNVAGGEINAANSGRAYRLLDGTTAVTDTTTGTLYLSWLFQSGQETGASTYQMLDLYNSTTADANRNFTAGLTGNGGQSGTQYDFGVDEAYSSTGISADTAVHQFVVRFDLSATAASDSVTVWLDPTSETGGTTVSGVDMTFDRLSLSDYEGNSASWDEIRFADTFNEVIPEPATFGLVGFFGAGVLFVRRRLMM